MTAGKESYRNEVLAKESHADVALRGNLFVAESYIFPVPDGFAVAFFL